MDQHQTQIERGPVSNQARISQTNTKLNNARKQLAASSRTPNHIEFEKITKIIVFSRFSENVKKSNWTYRTGPHNIIADYMVFLGLYMGPSLGPDMGASLGP